MSEPIVEPLSESTRAKIRSTQILTSLPQIVSELLQNSLDAGARHLDIGVDCEQWSCWVKDDGHGINKDGLQVLANGTETGRYGSSSSKAYTPDSLNVLSTFGFRGEALASAADLCCLEICSRTERSRDTWSIILKGGKPLYNGKAVRWQRETPGTTVCVRDAFYNVPVRRRSHPTPSRTMELIKQEVQAYALMFPDVVFSVQNTQNIGTSTSTKENVLRIPKTSSTVEAFGHLFGRALIKHVDEIDIESGKLKLSGFISLQSVNSKAYQYLYVNRHPIEYSDLHRIIDSHFNSSSFAKNALDDGGEVQASRTVSRRSPRKPVKKPVYVLNLTVPPNEMDNCLEPAKGLIHFQNKNAVEKLLSSAIAEFLLRHGFQSAATAKDAPSPSPSKRRKFDFDDSGYAEDFPEKPHFSEQEPRTECQPPLIIRHEGECFDTQEDRLVWQDPNTGESFLVDSRTGHSTPLAQEYNEEGRGGPSRRTLSFPSKAASTAQVPEWIMKALECNQAYLPPETKIPSVNLVRNRTIGEDDPTPRASLYSRDERKQLEQQFLSKQDFSNFQFAKSDLENAQVIGQVDKKFVACRLSSEGVDPRRSLVLVDQHAADERVRVEKFLKELCLGFLDNLSFPDNRNGTFETRKLSPPVPILLTLPEVARLSMSSDVQRAFANWGICFSDLSQTRISDGHSRNDDDGYSQVFVEKIPEVVSDKLLQGDELRDLVKGYLASLETDLALNPPTKRRVLVEEEGDENELVWLKALRWCPKELLDLINSKACRGAIMFNDPLSHEQCERLILQLSRTVFPFQCAHGRPSLVPIANLGNLSSSATSTPSWSNLEG